jgi:DNA polymerase-3 subunit delta'
MAKLAKKSSENMPPLPIDDFELLGFERLTSYFAEAISANRLHSAYIICGLEGIGKIRFALKLVAALLAPKIAEIDMFGETLSQGELLIDWDSPIIAQIAHYSNPDFLYIAPEYDEKKQKYKDIIQIDAVRRVSNFIHHKASNQYKVVLIEPLEAMNNAAANALLKCLEEPPPQTIFLTISHQPAKLLPTILSRCQLLYLNDLSQDNFIKIMKNQNVDVDNYDFLYHLSSGSVGLALQIQQTDYLDYFQKIVGLPLQNPREKLTKAIKISEIIAKDNAFNLKLFAILIDFLIYEIIYFSRFGQSKTNVISLETLSQIAAIKTALEWFDCQELIKNTINQASLLYFDKKQVILSCLSHF